MTAQEHRAFLETDFSYVKPEELADIGKIRIDRKKTAVFKASRESQSRKGGRYNG